MDRPTEKSAGSFRSARFDDIYFSPEDGLAESTHVFLAGNKLPARWAGKPYFTIAETGFGTGLNFLAAWRLFQQTARPGQRLDYIAFERYPLAAAEIGRALAPFESELQSFIKRLLQHYPLRIAGFHRIVIADNVTLTLVFDDVNEALPQLVCPQGIDAWFLDGFAPAKNPDMWTPLLYKEMAARAHEGTTLATFTAAGAVRRGLADAGFNVEKTKGYGRKREMVIGTFSREGTALQKAGDTDRIAIIGGGLAGTACGWALSQRGMSPVIFESEAALAAGASGNRCGLVNPRLSTLRDPASDFYSSAFSMVTGYLHAHKNEAGFVNCGSLHVISDPDKIRRFEGALRNWGWHDDHMAMLSPPAASTCAGIEVAAPALYLPDSGYVDPSALCRSYADGLDVRYGQTVPDIKRTGNDRWQVDGVLFDAVILANGPAAAGLAQLDDWLQLEPVRGQITEVAARPESRHLAVNLCYGGYISAHYDGRHMVGATFDRGSDHCDAHDADDRTNLSRLAEALPALAGNWEIKGHRASVRAAVQDRFPVAGPVPDIAGWQAGAPGNIEGLYMTAAHGSHGIVSTLASAMLLADQIAKRPYSQRRDVIEALAPDRFLRRAQKRGHL